MRQPGVFIPKGLDAHVHVREGKVLKHVLPSTARDFDRAVIMPNTASPVWDATSLRAYREEILAAAPEGFEPLMTIYLTKRTTPEVILEAGKAGAVAAKYYPSHGTTNSAHGLEPEEFLRREEWFEALAEAGMVLCIHAEHPKYVITRREHEFLKLFVDSELPLRFPKLRFVIEHVSSAYGLQVVGEYPNVAGTVTAHHLYLTTDDVIGNHHHMCMPVAKSHRDMMALRAAITIDKRSDLFLGSDSAPHQLSAKSQPIAKPGLYTAPVVLPLLARIFAEGYLGRLGDFVSTFGCEFYRVPPSKRWVEIAPEPHFVHDPTREALVARAEMAHASAGDADEDAKTDPPPPSDRLLDPIIPFYAGHQLPWSVRYDR